MLTAALNNVALRFSVPAPEAAAKLLTRLAALSVFVALLVSYPLWWPGRDLVVPYPVLPLPALPAMAEIFLWGLSLGICGLLVIFPQYRRLALIPVAIFVFRVLGDELRWSPFMYMYHFVLFVIGLLPARKLEDADLDPLRYMISGIYFWAGVHKLNAHFVFSVFPWFVSEWLPSYDAATKLGAFVPVLELMIGVCLVLPRWRVYGIGLALGMLVVVILSLSLHGWGMIVWMWNVLVFSLALTLFLHNTRPLLVWTQAKRRLCAVAIALFWFLPSLGSFGYWGDMPSFKLYCGCTPDLLVKVAPGEDLSFLPDGVWDEKNQAINGTLLTHSLYRVSTASSMPGSEMHQHFLRGICTHLSKPAEAKIIVRSFPYSLSLDKVDTIYPLCERSAAGQK